MDKMGVLFAIVDERKGSKVAKVLKEDSNISGATILIAEGTVTNKILEFLGLEGDHKEIVISIGDLVVLKDKLEIIANSYNFMKKGHGVGIIIPVCDMYTAKGKRKSKVEGEHSMVAIFTIVQKDKGEIVVECTRNLGARGATIIRGRGAGAEKAKTLFNMEIEPEKEIVLTVVESDIKENILDSIYKNLNLSKMGEGIIFTVPVIECAGFAKNKH